MQVSECMLVSNVNQTVFVIMLYINWYSHTCPHDDKDMSDEIKLPDCTLENAARCDTLWRGQVL